jgi:branched-chain amino acid transport system permease protein
MSGDTPTGSRHRLRGAQGWIVVAALAALAPYYLTEIELFSASRMVILALWAVSLNLLLGQTGLVSFAHAAYYGVGAYTVVLAWEHFDLSPLVGLPLALVVGAVVSLITGVIALRAVRLYFALLTLAISQLLYVAAFEWYGVTGGDNGIHGIGVPAFLESTVNAYWFVLAVAAAGIAALAVIGRSPFGAALVAIRENRLRAAFVGIDVKRHELAAFTLAGTFAALAGALFAIFNREAYPNLMFWTASSTPIFVVLIGGMYRFGGPVLGAVVLVLLEEAITRRTLYSDLVLGLVLLAIVLLAPGGLTEIGSRIRDRVRRRSPGREAEPERDAGALRIGAPS